MKKIFVIFIVAVLILAATISTSASENFANMQALWDHWAANTDEDDLSMYPEGICGVWCDGDMSSVTIAVTKDETGEAAKQTILASLKDAGGVSFTYGAYSHHELRGIQIQLEQRLTTDEWIKYGIHWMGVDEQHNVLAIGIDTDDPDSKEFIQTMFTMYHDRVVFEHCGGIFNCYTTDITSPKQADTKIYTITYNTMVDPGKSGFIFVGELQPRSNGYFWIVIPLLMLAIALIGTLIWIKRRNAAILSTGETVTASHTGVEQVVRDAAISPSPALDRRILDSIENQSK